jgi:predicted DNA-binding protein (MmcQ/YjbR family)
MNHFGGYGPQNRSPKTRTTQARRDNPRVTAAELRRWCLGRPGATEEFPFGSEVSVFKVAGKMFALGNLDSRPLEVSAKCDPDLADDLRATYAGIRPGYHLNKRHWNTITLDGSVPDGTVTQLLEDSYDLVVAGLPHAKREELGV